MKFKVALIALVTISVNGFSQKSVSKSISNENDKVKIHIEKEENGKKEVFDREYNVSGMSENEKQKLIDKVTDSLSAGSSENIRMRVKVDRDLADSKNGKKGKKRVEIYRKGDTEKENEENFHIDLDNDLDHNTLNLEDLDNLGQKLNSQMDRMKPMLKRFNGQLEPMMKSFGEQFGSGDSFGYFDNNNNSSKTVKRLMAYPNKPNNNRLNISFEAPEKGDVNITVTDLQGKVIGQEKVNDFEGEYMSQIDLKGNTKGTVFITVVQGNDGTVKRLVID